MKNKICEKCHFVFEHNEKDCMCLPEGMTCFDCKNFERCRALFGARMDGKSCDWYPIRFRKV